MGRDVAIAAWVGAHIGIEDFGLCVTIGIADSERILAGVVFNNYREPNIEATIASIDPRWCSRGALAAIFTYPFHQLGCRRVTAVTESTNQPARAFLCRLGFKQEGVMRQGFRGGGDAVIYGILRDECRWLRPGKPDEQRDDISAGVG